VHVLDELAFTGGMEVYGAEVLEATADGGQKILGEGERVAKAEARPSIQSSSIPTGTRSPIWSRRKRPNGLPISSSSARMVAGAAARLLGSDAEQIARHATVPVLLVRPRSES
jgi:hypothetical protein